MQVDVRFIAPLPGSRKRHHQYTAIDDCARIRVLRAHDRRRQATSVRFLDEVPARLPLRVETVQTDNGAAFQSGFAATPSSAASATVGCGTPDDAVR